MGRDGAADAPRGRDAMLASLSLAAGCVDAVCYLGLGQVFVANMTGNTVLLGLAIGQADGRNVLQSGTALVGFVLGVAAGAAIVERGPGTRARLGRPPSPRPWGSRPSCSPASRRGGCSAGPSPPGWPCTP